MEILPSRNHRHFLVKPEDIQGEKAVLTLPAEIHHLVNVLRLSVGEKVFLLDGGGGKYLSQIRSITPQRVEFEILSSLHNFPSPLMGEGQGGGDGILEIVLAVALVKRQAMDFIVEKAVEFGVTEIVPLKTDRIAVGAGSSRPDDSRYQRWSRIIQAAAKQSGQVVLPAIRPVTEFNGFLETPTFFLTPNPAGENFAKVLLEKKDLGKKICLMVGPEGGWSPREEAKAVESGAILVRLADHPLRCETAVVAALALLVNLNILKDL